MNKINQIFKKHWLTIILSIGLLALAIITINKNNEIKILSHHVSTLEYIVSSMENEKDDFENKLEGCNSEKDDFENNSSNQSYNNSSLQNYNSDLEYQIRNLKNELEECERKLRNCH